MTDPRNRSEDGHGSILALDFDLDQGASEHGAWQKKQLVSRPLSCGSKGCNCHIPTGSSVLLLPSSSRNLPISDEISRAIRATSLAECRSIRAIWSASSVNTLVLCV